MANYFGVKDRFGVNNGFVVDDHFDVDSGFGGTEKRRASSIKIKRF